MTQILSPFAIYFKHHWNPNPIWETFWTQTPEVAIERAKTLYVAIGEATSKVEIIKVVALQSDQAIIPPEVRRYNAAIISRNKHNTQNLPKSPGFNQKKAQIQQKG